MRGTYPGEMRVCVIGLVEAGASRREAAEQLEISASSAARWPRRWREDGSCEPKPRAETILAVVAKQSVLTLDELVSAMHKKRIRGIRTALWRFFARRGITVKKSLRAAEQERADVVRARRRWIREASSTPKRKDIVVIDNLPAHKVVGVDEVIKAVGALRYLPQYPRTSRSGSRSTKRSIRLMYTSGDLII